jgi:S1-C subfamily serine protease
VTETVKVLRNNGTLMSAVTPKDANIIFPMFLNAIKAYFNGHYWFGYDMSKKAEGGYMIDEIYPGMPFDKAGIKIGDIILTINGQEVKNVVEKKIKAVRFTDIFSPDPVNFVIKQNGVEKHYTIVPAFKEADYKPVSTKKE